MAHNPASTAFNECHLSKACMAVGWRCSTSTGRTSCGQDTAWDLSW